VTLPTLTIYDVDGCLIATSTAVAHRIEAVLYAPEMEPAAPTADISAPRQDPQHPDYLLCIEGERSWTFPLPASGEVIIGRNPDAGLRLSDDLVSREHAQLLVVPDGLRLSDLESRHGTVVNGQPVTGARMLHSGDVITIGGTLLIVHRPVLRGHGGRRMLDTGAWRARFEEELERARRYHRELAIVVIRTRSTAFDRADVTTKVLSRVRSIDVAAFLSDRELVVMMPEADADEAAALAHELRTALPKTSAGIATSPSDGVDVDSLLSTTRASATSTEATAFARDLVQQLELGDHRVVLADPAMVRTYDLIQRLARSSLPVLIQGETGVGKELAAAAVHQFSPRAKAVFVSINCATIPEHLAESELFGHERGAFTGAIAAKQGQLESASGGTVFLDEIGEMPLAIQAKLLRVLETGEIHRVGDNKPRTTDIRIVAATNRDLAAEVAAGRFRQDLFFRLGAAQLIVPPLRDRPRDLALLIQRMFGAACERLGRRSLPFTVAAQQLLLLHTWPGNVRELKNAMEYTAATLPETAVEVDAYHLPPTVRPLPAPASATAAPSEELPRPAISGEIRPIDDEVRELERRRMVEALSATGGVQNRAAEMIRMPLRTFVTKLKRYGITSDEY
jgi:two-component system response regulator AtoC